MGVEKPLGEGTEYHVAPLVVREEPGRRTRWSRGGGGREGTGHGERLARRSEVTEGWREEELGWVGRGRLASGKEEGGGWGAKRDSAMEEALGARGKVKVRPREGEGAEGREEREEGGAEKIGGVG